MQWGLADGIFERNPVALPNKRPFLQLKRIYKDSARARVRNFVGMIKNSLKTGFYLGFLAEAVRFELTEGANPRRFSRPVP